MCFSQTTTFEIDSKLYSSVFRALPNIYDGAVFELSVKGF